MTKSEIQSALDSNIPKDVIETREQAGRTLSYLATWYVIDRLNQVLGQGNWGYQIKQLDKVFEGTIQQSSGEVFTTSYTAQVALFATVEGKTVIFTEVGYGDGTDRKSQGKAHELATKEAVSDALKRGAKNLGRSMGLALYDKTQEFVGTGVVETPRQEASKILNKDGGVSKEVAPVATVKVQTKTPVVANNQSKGVGGHNNIAESDNTADGRSTPQHEANGSAPINRPIKDLITSAFKVLEAQKKITKEEFKTKYQKGAGLSTLSEPTLQFILNSLKTDFPGLGL